MKNPNPKNPKLAWRTKGAWRSSNARDVRLALSNTAGLKDAEMTVTVTKRLDCTPDILFEATDMQLRTTMTVCPPDDLPGYWTVDVDLPVFVAAVTDLPPEKTGDLIVTLLPQGRTTAALWADPEAIREVARRS